MDREEAKRLLQLDTRSEGFYQLLSRSNQRSRKAFGERGYIFAQIGLNADPCSKNCRFCSLASSHYVVSETGEKRLPILKDELQGFLADGIDDFFLMTTADYPMDKYLKIATELRKELPDTIRFVSNVGDMDLDTAKRLKEVGFTGSYHIRRLREGIDTLVDPKEREATMHHILQAGLELYYCIEPIGPEHSYDEILDEIYFAKEFPIHAMAVMRRTPVPGTPLFELGAIDAMELTKIAAVTNLIIKPSRSMNVHEPNLMSLLGGVNQLYAEVGTNPRDTNNDTEKARGFSVKRGWEMLGEAGYFSAK